jgi:hypothetical protein
MHTHTHSHDTPSARKAPVTVSKISKTTVSRGRPYSVGPCAAAGQLKHVQQCESSAQDTAAGGGSEGDAATVSMQCTRIPGLVPSNYANDPDGGARVLGPAARCGRGRMVSRIEGWEREECVVGLGRCLV